MPFCNKAIFVGTGTNYETFGCALDNTLFYVLRSGQEIMNITNYVLRCTYSYVEIVVAAPFTKHSMMQVTRQHLVSIYCSFMSYFGQIYLINIRYLKAPQVIRNKSSDHIHIPDDNSDTRTQNKLCVVPYILIRVPISSRGLATN